MNRKLQKILKVIGIVFLLVIILLVGFIWGASFILNKTQKSNITEMNLSHEKFIDDFTEINNIVNENYSHLESKQINIDSLYHIYSNYANTAKTTDEYKKLLLAYFSELKNMHANMYFTPTYYINCDAKLVDNKVFIDRVDHSERKIGINEKDEILSIDGIPTLEWLNQQQKYVNASTDKARLNHAVSYIFFSYFKDKRTLLLDTSTGIKEVELLFRKKSSDVESSLINDSIGYICINSMEGNVIADFKEEFEKLQANPILIIDLRNNGGGNSSYSEEITEYLIQKEQKACVSGKILEPQKNYYKGKLLVLTGFFTASAAENLVLDLKESGNAVLIGSETGGDTGNRPKRFTTKYGTSFRIPTRKPAQISPQGFPMEGIGIPPDFTVYQTIDDYLNNIDTVLEFAINKASKLE